MRISTRLSSMAVGLLSIAGFFGIARSQALQGAPPIPCPAAGTTVSRSNGASVHYLGSDPSDPTLCKAIINGESVENLFGVWGVGSELNAGNTAKARVALTKVLSGPDGTSASFDGHGSYRSPRGQLVPYDLRITFVNEGTEPFMVAGRPYPAIRLHGTYDGIASLKYSSTRDFWLDPKTGILLRLSYHRTDANYQDTSWSVLSIVHSMD